MPENSPNMEHWTANMQPPRNDIDQATTGDNLPAIEDAITHGSDFDPETMSTEDGDRVWINENPELDGKVHSVVERAVYQDGQRITKNRVRVYKYIKTDPNAAQDLKNDFFDSARNPGKK